MLKDEKVREAGSRVLHDQVHDEARKRHLNDATMSGYDHHVVVVAAEHGARIALSTPPAQAEASTLPNQLHQAVERFLADYDDGDRADAGLNPLMEAHIADFRRAVQLGAQEASTLPGEVVDLLLKQATAEWSYHEDDYRYPRDFWHVRHNLGDLSTEWMSWGKQERRNLSAQEKAEGEVASLDNLRCSMEDLFPPTTPAVESGEDAAEALWNALKARCCGDPKEAKRIVMLSKEDFLAAINGETT